MLISPVRDEDAGVAGPSLDCEGFFPPYYSRGSRPVGPIASAYRRWRWTIRARMWKGANRKSALICARAEITGIWFLGRARRSWRAKEGA